MLRDELLAILRRADLRCTPQRYEILSYLARNPSHPTAEMVFRAVNRKIPHLSRATVYNTLRTFAEAKLVRELRVLGDSTRFETNIERHHHFVCENCGRVEDIAWFDLPRAAVTAAAGPRTVHACEVIVRGVCGPCSGISKKH